MLQKLIPLFLVIITQGVLLAVVSTALATAASSTNSSFIFNGFQDANIRLNGAAKIEPGGILRLTNTTTNDVGHAFYPKPFPFLNSSSGEALSFSTSFVFAIVPQFQNLSSHGLAFTISPSPDISAGFPDQYFGLFNMTHNGNPKNRIVAVELDTIQNKEFYDINNNHVGIDVNSVISLSSAPASYAVRSSTGPLFHNLSLISGKPMRIWVEYDGKNMQFNVTIAPLDVVKPYVPLLSSIVNLSSVFLDQMFVGFCSSTGAIYGMHYILGWSFSSNGNAEDLDLSNIPPIPGRVVQENSRKPNKSLSIVLPIGITLLVLSTVAGVLIVLVRRRKKFSVMIEDRDTVYGPRRFLYRTLYRATGGFSNKNLLGSGGFGKVYKGQLQKSKKEIAVKRISEYSRQGMKEFISEISTIGRLRHRNLVQLLGYSQGRELLLVYDYMPKGSLDKYIFGRPQEPLNWPQRFKIIKDIASGLLYLHEEWEQTVIHRDIKASNVLLDAEFNAKLGISGLRGSLIARATRTPHASLEHWVISRLSSRYLARRLPTPMCLPLVHSCSR
ncbi:hypothetical protein HPP92_003036 [Vanilla planifolia]|uniref:non-specific serine/threonine protein kinase n=1 Tax=Vanilla planifolia TaxID=51239 RepID=A0A835S7D8_VANPL|nr:hypothetical protein HPP92_003036 [Vanilla planifolia]